MGLRGNGDPEPPGGGPWRAWILGPDGREPAGAAVLTTHDTLLTCTHVVERALGGSYVDDPPQTRLAVAFPSAHHGAAPSPPGSHAAPGRPAPAHAPAHVPAAVAEGGWLRSPRTGHLAVLRLLEPAPPGAAPAALGRCGDAPGGRRVAVFGRTPAGGRWVRAAVAGPPSAGTTWRRLEGVRGGDVPAGALFDGAGVRDEGTGRVLGVVAVLAPSGMAWMVPADALDGTRFGVPARGNSATGQNATEPPGTTGQDVTGSRASTTDLWPLVECLLAVESVAADGGAALLALLPDRIRWGIPRNDRPRLQVLQIVRRCAEFEEGPAALVEAVQWMEGETTAVSEFVQQARRAWPDGPGGHG